MTEKSTTEEKVEGMPDRLRLYANFWPTVQITMTADQARLMADDLERGVAHRPRLDPEPPAQVEPVKPKFLQRVARFVLTKYR